MSEVDDAKPDMGAVRFYQGEIGAWQFAVYPPAIRPGKLRSRPMVTGAFESIDVVTGKLKSQVLVEGKFGADQT